MTYKKYSALGVAVTLMFVRLPLRVAVVEIKGTVVDVTV